MTPDWVSLTLSWRRLLSYRNQSIDLRNKSIDWFLYDNGLRHERFKLRHDLTIRFQTTVKWLKWLSLWWQKNLKNHFKNNNSLNSTMLIPFLRNFSILFKSPVLIWNSVRKNQNERLRPSQLPDKYSTKTKEY